MPFKSKAQWRKFFAMSRRGEMPESKAREWAHETKTPFKRLPEKKKRTKKAAYLLHMAADLGRMRALDEAGLEKDAGILSGIGSILLPAGIGFTMAPKGREREAAAYGGLAGLLGGAMGRNAFKKLAPNAKSLFGLLGAVGIGSLPVIALQRKGEAIKSLTNDIKDSARKIDALPADYLIKQVRQLSPKFQAKRMAGLQPAQRRLRK